MNRALRIDSTLYDAVQGIERCRRRAVMIIREDDRLPGMHSDGVRVLEKY